MSRSRIFTAILTTLAISVVSDPNLNSARAGNIKIPTQTADTSFLCYIKTEDGRTVDLTKMCGYISPAVCSTVNNDPAKAALVADFCKKHERCRLTNSCDQQPMPMFAPSSNLEQGSLPGPFAIASSLLPPKVN